MHWGREALSPWCSRPHGKIPLVIQVSLPDWQGGQAMPVGRGVSQQGQSCHPGAGCGLCCCHGTGEARGFCAASRACCGAMACVPHEGGHGGRGPVAAGVVMAAADSLPWHFLPGGGKGRERWRRAPQYQGIGRAWPLPSTTSGKDGLNSSWEGKGSWSREIQLVGPAQQSP